MVRFVAENHYKVKDIDTFLDDQEFLTNWIRLIRVANAAEKQLNYKKIILAV
ncbi:MAG: hypothetical protein WAM27_09990 [Nitrososphaeraceae archaeon]